MARQAPISRQWWLGAVGLTQAVCASSVLGHSPYCPEIQGLHLAKGSKRRLDVAGSLHQRHHHNKNKPEAGN